LEKETAKKKKDIRKSNGDAQLDKKKFFRLVKGSTPISQEENPTDAFEEKGGKDTRKSLNGRSPGTNAQPSSILRAKEYNKKSGGGR